MSELHTHEGFPYAFMPSKCAECGGKCCVGESGFVYLDIDEMRGIAAFLGISLESFAQKFIRKVGYKFSLIEKPHPSGFACVFFDDEKKCEIYSVRPKHCRAFPFWEIFRKNPAGAFRECPGVCEIQSPQDSSESKDSRSNRESKDSSDSHKIQDSSHDSKDES